MSKTIGCKRMIDEEEQYLVHKAAEIEINNLETGKTKKHTFQKIKESISS